MKRISALFRYFDVLTDDSILMYIVPKSFSSSNTPIRHIECSAAELRC
ncbi:hypothetical protein [Olivibacter ginsenosidimutans]